MKLLGLNGLLPYYSETVPVSDFKREATKLQRLSFRHTFDKQTDKQIGFIKDNLFWPVPILNTYVEDDGVVLESKVIKLREPISADGVMLVTGKLVLVKINEGVKWEEQLQVIVRFEP